MEGLTPLQLKDKICQANPALAPMLEITFLLHVASVQATLALTTHDETYPQVEKAGNTAWLLWRKIGRTAPDDWQPKCLTKYHEKSKQLLQECRVAFKAAEDARLTLVQDLTNQVQATTLGKVHFGHSSKPNPKPAKQR